MTISKTQKSGPKKWMVDLGLVNGKRHRRFFATQAQAAGLLAARRRERETLGTQTLTLTDAERAEYLAVKNRAAANAAAHSATP